MGAGAQEPLVLLTHGVSGTPSEQILDSARVVEFPDTDPESMEKSGAAPYRGTFTTYPNQPAHLSREQNRVAYRWGNMTSGLAVQAIWILFAPFALVNVSAWMLPTSPPKNTAAKVSVSIARAVLRLLGLALTATMVAQLAFLIDAVLFSHLSSKHWQNIWETVCLTVLFAAGGFVAFYGDNDRDVDYPTNTPATLAPAVSQDVFVRPSDGRATLLVTTHAVTGLLTATLVVGDDAIPGWLRALVVAMLVIVSAATAACTDPRATSTPLWWTRFFVGLWAVLWVAGAYAVFLAAAMLGPARPAGTMIAWLFYVDALLVALAIVATFCALTLPSSRLAPWFLGTGPSGPWLRGLHGPLVAALGVVWGVGLGMGLTRVVAHLLGRDGPGDLPDIYTDTAWMWGVTVIVCAVGAVVFLVGIVVANGRERSLLTVPQQKSAGLDPTTLTPRAAFTLKLNWSVATAKLTIPACILVVALCAMTSGLFARLDRLTLHLGVVDDSGPVQVIGIVALALIDLLLLRALYKAARSPRKSGRSLGVLWDLASFWPRQAHPLVPPAYAPRAIRDLQRFLERVWEDNPTRDVILASHSQGSMIMYALAYRLTPARPQQISMLTYGSQLGWAYGRAFPAALSHETHLQLRCALHGRWINLVRFTDYIGDGVVCLTRGHTMEPYVAGTGGSIRLARGRYLVEQTLELVSQEHEPVKQQLEPVKQQRKLVEVWLPDPSPADYPPNTTHQHSAYTSDASWDIWIDVLTGGSPPDLAEDQAPPEP